MRILHISIHALREEGDHGQDGERRRVVISIHALREEGDQALARDLRRFEISIHALREEGDTLYNTEAVKLLLFLSTPSARRATRPACLPQPLPSNFYPRPPRGGRLGAGRHGSRAPLISIHALREEGDVLRLRPPEERALFLSTPSARRATEVVPDDSARHVISIHALREEGDAAQ